MRTDITTVEAKQRPILFSTEMVQAILADRKTMTRRVIKAELDSRGLRWANPKTGWEDWHGNPVRCPYGQVGDILWVRETWCKACLWDGDGEMPECRYWYKADDDWKQHDWHDDKNDEVTSAPKWKPSIHMPKEAARLFLQITDIRVERLQDISDVDAMLEGIESMTVAEDGELVVKFKDYLSKSGWYYDSRESFKTLWMLINGFDNWNANPWVWVVSFERISKPQ